MNRLRKLTFDPLELTLYLSSAIAIVVGLIVGLVTGWYYLAGGGAVVFGLAVSARIVQEGVNADMRRRRQ